MVATPATALAATLGTEAAFAGHIVDDTITEMWSMLSVTARMLFGTHIFHMDEFTKLTGMQANKANGFQAKVLKKSTASGIEKFYQYQPMSTPANTSLAAAGAVNVDQAPTAMNTRVLTGDYGVSYGYANRELWHKVRGGPGGEMRNDMSVQLATDLAQTMSTHINTNMFADGTVNSQDGFEHWVKQNGTKWNSEDIAVTATYLQGRLENTLTLATWTSENIRGIIRRTHQGLIGTSISEYPKTSNFCVVSSAMLDKLKNELDKLKIIHQGPDTAANAQKFPFLGMIDDYVIVDGCCFFTDYWIDKHLDGNAGIGYMGHTDHFEIICHKDYMFSDWDAVKEDTKIKAKWKNLPNRLDRDVYPILFLWNLFHKRPRNFTKIVLAT